MKKHFRSWAIAAAVACMASTAVAQQSGSGTTQGARPAGQGQGRTSPSAGASSADKSTLSSSDEKFIKEAAQGGMAEVELGRLAATKASNPEVKQFGQRMVDDHSKANTELMDIAKRKNVTVPTALAGKHKSEHDRLAKLTGAEFDRAYVRLMLDDHRKDVAEFKKEASSAKDSDLRSFASQSLPVLQQHLTAIEQLSSHEATATSGRSTGSSKPQGTGGTNKPQGTGAPPPQR